MDRALRREEPRFLTHILTYRCNARCTMCDSWMRPNRDELDASTIEAIYHKLPPMDGVRLTGGEPFLRSDFPVVAEMAQRILRPVYLHVTTNGFLTRKIVEFCSARDPSVPLHLMVSVDGLGSSHDSIRGKSGAFDAAMETLEQLVAIRRRANIRLSANQTIVSPSGIAEIVPLSERMSRIGVEHQIVLAYRSSATYSSEWDPERKREQIGSFTPFADLDADEVEALVAAMKVAERRADPILRLEKGYYRNGLHQRLSGRPALSPACAELAQHLRLLPDGTVPVCQFNGEKVGNLARIGLSEMRKAESHRKARKWVVGCSGCWAECEVAPNAFYSGDLFRYALGMNLSPRSGGGAPDPSSSAIPRGEEVTGEECPAPAPNRG